MYFVDRQKIEKILQYIESTLALFEGYTSWNSRIELLALERICHTLIEGILDVGNAMIDGFIMRDPGSYEDIIIILEDEKVLSSEVAKEMKAFIILRKMLVQEYYDIDHAHLLTQLKESLHSMKAFPPSVRTYLENELGPVTAFKSE